ncbi:multidrug effflux MFS transporter [soil metagenome]
MSKRPSYYSCYELQIIFTLAAFCMLIPFGIDGYVPSLPAMTRELGGNIQIMQLTVSLYLLGNVLSQLLCGPISDKFGRRHIILTGLIIGILGCFICIMARGPYGVVLGRLVQGLGMGCCNALYRAVMRDIFSGARMAKMASYVSGIYTMAVALAPLCGGYIQTMLNWKANFGLFIVLATLTLIGAYLFLPETNHRLDSEAIRPHNILHNYRILLSSRTFMGHALCSSMLLAGIIAYFTTSPFLLQNILGLSAAQYGWISMLVALGLMIGNVVNSLLVIRFGIQHLIIVGIVMALLSGCLMLVLATLDILNVASIIVPILLFSIANGFIATNSTAGAFQAFPHIAGTAGALYGAIQIFVALITSLLVVGLDNNNQMPLALILLGIGISNMLIYWFMLNVKVEV